MKEIIDRIKSKFGMSSYLVIYLDGSGHINTGIFDEEDEDFKVISFNSILELKRLLNLE